jgi:hypothetical protein
MFRRMAAGGKPECRQIWICSFRRDAVIATSSSYTCYCNSCTAADADSPQLTAVTAVTALGLPRVLPWGEDQIGSLLNPLEGSHLQPTPSNLQQHQAYPPALPSGVQAAGPSENLSTSRKKFDVSEHGKSTVRCCTRSTSTVVPVHDTRVRGYGPAVGKTSRI